MPGNEDMYWRPLEGEIMTHPEVELRMVADDVDERILCLSKPTIMDILEIYLDRPPVVLEKLGGSDFMKYLEFSEKQTQKPSLRVIFLDYLNQKVLYAHLLGHTQDEFPDDITRLMHRHYGIPLSYFRYLSNEDYLKYSQAARSSFVRKYQDGVNISLDGLYQSQFANDQYSKNSCYVWFSLSFFLGPKSRTSNYVIHGDVPDLKEQIFACVKGGEFEFLLRPFAIDVFIQDSCIKSLMFKVQSSGDRLWNYEGRYIDEHIPASSTMDEIPTLLTLSQIAKNISASLSICKHTITYLMATLERHRDQFSHEGLQTSHESLALVNERAKDLMLYRQVLDERIRIQIDIAYNHSSRLDNQVNIRIAQLTSKIAIAAQQDSSAMITIAAVTMFFLPGTFVSALFSMVFFSTSTSPDGGTEVLTLSSQCWIYFAITIPLTALVFLTWHMWRRHRTARAMNALEDLHSSDVESESATEESISHPKFLPHAFGEVRRRILGLRKALKPSGQHDLEQGLGDKGASNEVKGSKAE